MKGNYNPAARRAVPPYNRNRSGTNVEPDIRLEAGVGTKGVYGHYQGKASTLLIIGGCAVAVAAIAVFAWPRIRRKLGQTKSGIRIKEDKQQSELRKDEAKAYSELKMKEAEVQTDLDIKKAEEASRIKTGEMREIYKIRQEFGLLGQSAGQERAVHEETAPGEWLQWFAANFPMPCCSAIPHVSTVLNGCPDDFRPAMLFHLLGTYGALAFSGVRAKYLDRRYHSPSLQVVIEGGQGSGKSIFKNVYEQDLFQRVVMADREKAGSDSPGRIVQTIGIETSRTRFVEIMAGNHGVCLYAMETEIDSVLRAFRKDSGLSSDLLRKAFSNEAVSLDSRHTRTECRGVFPVHLNYTFTGTPKAVSRFFREEEYEDGTASRVCFCVIPELGRSNPEFELPDGQELEKMRDRIDGWRRQYCFKTGGDGVDVPADEYITDLSYVFGVLEKWIERQKEMGDGIRKGVSLRMATIAFHAAIVLHMLAGEPGEDNLKMRKAICRLATYIADHCMERFLCRYHKGAYPKMDKTAVPPLGRKLTDEEVKYWYPLWQTADEDGQPLGYGRIAKRIGVDRDSVRNAFKRYEGENGWR